MFMFGFTLMVHVAVFAIIAKTLKDNPVDKFYYLSAVAVGCALATGIAALAWPLAGQVAPFWGGPLLALTAANVVGAFHWRRRYVAEYTAAHGRRS